MSGLSCCRKLLAIVCFITMCITSDPEAYAARDIPSMSSKANKLFAKAQTAMHNRDYAAAERFLQEVLARKKTNDYERAIVWQTRAMIEHARGDMPAMIQNFESMLEYRQSLPEALENIVLMQLARSYHLESDTEKAQAYAAEWEAKAEPGRITPEDLAFIAVLRYLQADYPATIEYTDRAVALAEAVGPGQVKETWYQIGLAAHLALGQTDEASTIILDRLNGKTRATATYCRWLAGVYVAAGQSESDALSAAKAANPTCSNVAIAAAPPAPEAPQKKPKPKNDLNADMIPLIRVQPQMPRAAIEGRTEGSVLVSFTVLPNGAVDRKSLKILESTPPGMFEASVLKAAAEMRYRPKMVDGIPQKVEGVTYRFSFTFAD